MFISRGLVSLLLHLTQIEEPEEVCSSYLLVEFFLQLSGLFCLFLQLSGKVLVSALSALRNLCLPGTVGRWLVSTPTNPLLCWRMLV